MEINTHKQQIKHNKKVPVNKNSDQSIFTHAIMTWVCCCVITMVTTDSVALINKHQLIKKTYLKQLLGSRMRLFL